MFTTGESLLRQRARSAATLSLALVVWSSVASAQRSAELKGRSPLGCWRTEVGTFRATTRIGIDSGLTNVPPQVRLDTLPGRGWHGEPVGRLLRAIPGRSGSRYRDGYFIAVGADSLALEWTNGTVGLSIHVRVRTDTMRGIARAWTDYLGEQTAPITMHRVECPTVNSRDDR